jgi:hypothetical protein
MRSFRGKCRRYTRSDINAGGNGSSEFDEHRLGWGKLDEPYELFLESMYIHIILRLRLDSIYLDGIK